ncbi:MAG TPA: VWA domain-containing protein [Bryobacteraceae bacterium]|nr:VWA domain-containing protein [Bryobacteraceae bacterium]
MAALPVLVAAGVAYMPRTADNRPAERQGVFTISDNVNLVLLDVSVKGPRGGYVTGLEKKNFSVFEDGRHQTITQFASIDTPVSIGLVVDNSGSMGNKKGEIIMAGLSFARQSNSHDEFFVVNFNNSVVRGLPANMMFTDNLNQIRSALYYGRPVGQTALYDAVAYSLKHLQHAHLEKQTLIVVSDGGDNVSKTNLPELMKLIEASRASIYTVGIYDADDPTLNPGVLRKISAISGGEFFEPKKLDDVLPTFDKISRDIRNTYSIGYVPNETTDHRVLRSVKVVAEEEGRKLAVHTRKSYIATPLAEVLAAEATKNQVENKQ